MSARSGSQVREVVDWGAGHVAGDGPRHEIQVFGGNPPYPGANGMLGGGNIRLTW